MKIAQVAPLYESVPPHGYGGTERVVSYLTEELVRLGEEVTLFASGDSKTAAHLIPISPRSLRLSKAVDTLAHHIVLLEEVFQRLDQFDIVHFHIDYLHFPLSRRASFAHVDHLARPARPARSAAGLQRVSRYACCLHFAFAAAPTAASSMGGNGLPWVTRRFFRLPGKAGGLFALSRADFAGKTSGPSH